MLRPQQRKTATPRRPPRQPQNIDNNNDKGGITANASTCPRNFPAAAGLSHCAHVSFVEVDAAMAYRYAVAYVATGDARHAENAAGVLRAWLSANRAFGLKAANGPLEAAWGCAAMARAMELLRSAWPGLPKADVDAFVRWVDAKLMPNVDHFVDVLSAYPRAPSFDRRTLTLGNWHASCADCLMAAGVLADDAAKFERGRELYRATVASYLKWGRAGAPPQWASAPPGTPRLAGESTETLRDIYHSLFGIGSLMQAAETAWAQDEDEYAASGHALASALELHARVVNARLDGDEGGLPPRYRFFESMPAAPKGCAWRWSVGTQGWASFNVTAGGEGRKCSDLSDGLKYALGIKYLPTGFEVSA